MTARIVGTRFSVPRPSWWGSSCEWIFFQLKLVFLCWLRLRTCFFLPARCFYCFLRYIVFFLEMLYLVSGSACVLFLMCASHSLSYPLDFNVVDALTVQRDWRRTGLAATQRSTLVSSKKSA